jgi:hypothetical protein
MSISAIITAIDNEIARLKQAKELLSGTAVGNASPTVKRGRGRPRKESIIATPKPRKKLSASARAKIAAAQKARWAKVKAAKAK